MQLDPIAFEIGAFQVRWYSLSYLTAFLTVYLLIIWRTRKDLRASKVAGKLGSNGLIEEMFIFALVGMLIGSRLGYLFFYDFSEFVQTPLSSLFGTENGTFTGLFGFSYHGGLMGIILAGLIFCKKNNFSFLELADFVVPAIPLGYMWGRIGNFMNGELFGRPTELPWGMNFPLDQTNLLRHPSQLYEAFFEGLLLFLILWPVRNKKIPKGGFLGIYLLGYGLSRFIIEFFRQPDPQLGYVILGLTMGQLLCFGMIIVGISLIKPVFKKI